MADETSPKSRSKKTAVIEKMFFDRWDPVRNELTKSMMTFEDVRAAIVDFNVGKPPAEQLSPNNVANFMKDVVRGKSASRNWPTKLHEMAYTARQTPGEGNVFEFIKYPEGQGEAFPDEFIPTRDTRRIPVQSVSLPLQARKLGRGDEPWLIQTAINLKIVETHFAVASQLPVTQLTHLQMSVKLRRTEIDALFLAIVEATDGSTYEALVTCEAKGPGERILEDQIVNQVRAAFETTHVNCVVPLGIRAIANEGLYVVEFAAVERSNVARLETLEIASAAVYVLQPPVPGINDARERRSGKRRPIEKS